MFRPGGTCKTLCFAQVKSPKLYHSVPGQKPGQKSGQKRGKNSGQTPGQKSAGGGGFFCSAAGMALAARWENFTMKKMYRFRLVFLVICPWALEIVNFATRL